MNLSKEMATDVARILRALINTNEVGKLQSTFISAFRDKTILKTDGRYYLHGNFNLGGTVSGRMSSSSPNLQNQPSTGSQYAKKFKACFVPPKGWLLVGADFAGLEDRISALTTKDPNKLKVFIEGFDGHCLRAHAYFGDVMPDITPNDVISINSIAEKYPDLRQDSKPITFALTYQGTEFTLMNNLGLPPDTANQVTKNYHVLYKVSDDWVQEKLAEASVKGYIEVAFGLRVRTPILAQTLLNKRTTPKEAQAEGRTAGNALGQSYGLLNNRSAVEFMDKVYASEYTYDIMPIAQVHDSQYYLIRAKPEILQWVNTELIKSMNWQGLDEIKHDTVTLDANLELLYPTMADSIKLPNNLNTQDLLTFLATKCDTSALFCPEYFAMP